MTDAAADEETLDPANWAETREVGARMMQQMFDDLESVRSRPPWRKIPDEAKKSLDVAAPRAPQNLDSVHEEYRRNIEPYAVGNRHPKFWGWVVGGGTPVGILGDMLASSMNTNAGGRLLMR